ncbi:topoisomerase II-associated protein PAT1 [Metarhizium album ARSEF 1941]|uniref:Topoisomerase II-associated protein PAT1 n=1 Tax=Metarhizium album (strain ARSEF 1941) TaxID=1081103 RepID=A0A0B2WZX8_METAS|nr:topoisomerase II-associated protein PAT1 [Metarhizium album ARSEF 1941]KHN98992.1 topoisomerase II-associated protein PAT1 [Metarhizium album ARSEF 1941]
MSFFGFDTGPRGHNTAAPGFSQAHDPFAGLSGRGDQDDALDFEDTYDGLGDQLDETDDVFNDDTFGGESAVAGNVGKDFDFFGQTAKVADAIEEEHLRFNRQQPASRATAPQPQPQPSSSQTSSYYPTQSTQKPVRSGYEKYKEAEPLPDLHVDQSIWGIGPAKSTAKTSQSAAQPPSASASRKVLSLEEVEASMRAQVPKQTQPQITLSDPAIYQQGQAAEYTTSQQAAQHQQQQGHPVHGPPVTILQRPQSMQTRPSEQLPTPPQLQSRQQAPPVQPTQILQNPNRLSGEAAPPGPRGHRSQGSIPGLAQLQAHPQILQMSEGEKVAFLDQETKRAKRNHKIWLLSKDNGLMTPQDKNFITRIQLQQLVSATGNPVEGSDSFISEDFYYQVYSHIRAGQRQNPSQPLSNFAQTYLFQTGSRHGGMRRHGRPAENHIQRMEQQVQRAVEAAKNKPKNPQLVIAGSLGKISFSNAKTPKPLLNIKRAESETLRPSNGKKSPHQETVLDRKRILRNVEKVYDILMKIEDHIRLVPPPMGHTPEVELEEQHQQWTTTLDAYNAKLWTELKVHEPIGATVPHPFIAFLSCAKGKKAVPRIFPHLTFEQRTTILTMIIYHLDQLDVVQGAVITSGETDLNSRMRENIELFISTVMPSLMQYFNETGLDIVDGVLHLIATKLNVDLIARTRIGVSMLTLILSRAVLLKQTGAGNPEQWEKWDQTFEILFSKLEPSLPHIFPGSVNAGIDVYVWQLLAAMGVSATQDQQTRLVLAVKDRVLDTVSMSKTLPPTMAAERLGSVNLFMRSIGLDVELLQ